MNGAARAGRSGAVSPPVALAAAEWFLLLQSPEATANDHARFEQWCASASEHQMAWQRVQRISGSLGAIPPSLGLQTLQRSQGIDRRTALRSLALLVAAPPAAWLAQRHLPWQAWSADQRTGVGEHRWITLVDGGLVHLNTATAVDVRYDAQLRLRRLRQGEILIQTAQDPAGRSFIVETQQGQIRALGTRFVVRQLDAATQVTVLEHAVEIRAGSAPGVQILHQGQQLRFGSQAPGSVQPASAHADDWSRGIVY
ncbi:FecR domain-containing protein, partial [Nevskia sp.]|uniref:FecR domain-containing protein n=1 Tax=Nevskia sp. TaxID=1929292 RepID=UPI0025F621C0